MRKLSLILILTILLTGCGVAAPVPPATEPSQSDVPADATLPPETAMPTVGATEATMEATLPNQPSLTVVIDPGHQKKGNYDKEPVGPGATEMKAKVSSGTQGVVTGLEEYQLNLMVALKLQAILESRGYHVVMIRTTHDVDISNAERAQIANDLRADAFVRIHANGSDDSDVQGIMTLCQTAENPYNGALYPQSSKLAELVLEEMVTATGAKKQFVWETDTMSGINWCQVPVTIVEMGYLSNPQEDERLSTDSYQEKIAQGIANGLDRFFDRAE